MTTIAIDRKYLDVLASLGDADEMVEEALRRYTVEQIASKVTDYRREVAGFEAAYGMQYEVFCFKITAEDGFTKKVRDKHPSWEVDLNAWEFYAEGLKTWLGRLDNISKT